MASTTTDRAAVVRRVVDYARDRLELELERLTEAEAQYHARSTERLTPLKNARQVKLNKTLDMRGLTAEEAVAKALDLVLEYWKKHNKVGIAEAIRTPGRKDIAKAAELKAAKVKAVVLQKLKQDPGFFRDDEEEAAVDPGDQVRESVETDDTQDLFLDTPTRGRNQTRGQQLHRQQHRLDMQGKRPAPVSLSPRKLRFGRRVARGRGQDQSPSRSPTKTDHDRQLKDGEPAPTRIERSRSPADDKHPDESPVKVDPSPESDAVKSAHPTTPTREAPRRYPRRGGSKMAPNAANATVIVTPRPTRRRAVPKSVPARKTPSAQLPPPKRRETKADGKYHELEQQLDLLKANMKSQQEAVRKMERELHDAQRVATDMRRMLARLELELAQDGNRL